MTTLSEDPNKQEIKDILDAGKQSEFWRIICRGIDETIEGLEALRDSDVFEDLKADEYKIQSELIKARISHLKRLKEFPDNVFEELVGIKQSDQNFDPYSNSEDFLPKK